jgi:hypothetical protein
VARVALDGGDRVVLVPRDDDGHEPSLAIAASTSAAALIKRHEGLLRRAAAPSRALADALATITRPAASLERAPAASAVSASTTQQQPLAATASLERAPAGSAVSVSDADFAAAVATTRPSCSERDIARMARLYDAFANRGKRAADAAAAPAVGTKTTLS